MHACARKLHAFHKELPLGQPAIIDVQIQAVHGDQHLLALRIAENLYLPCHQPGQAKPEPLKVQVHATFLEFDDHKLAPALGEVLGERVRHASDQGRDENKKHQTLKQAKHAGH